MLKQVQDQYFKKKEAFASIGIKNSWKYEKDLIVLNQMQVG
jgi:hypothetical protein